VALSLNFPRNSRIRRSGELVIAQSCTNQSAEARPIR
jgi:hypothetical protein